MIFLLTIRISNELKSFEKNKNIGSAPHNNVNCWLQFKCDADLNTPNV